MIKERHDGLIDENALSEEEKKIFIQFLKHEKNRHLGDIAEINKTIYRIEKGGEKQ